MLVRENEVRADSLKSFDSVNSEQSIAMAREMAGKQRLQQQQQVREGGGHGHSH